MPDAKDAELSPAGMTGATSLDELSRTPNSFVKIQFVKTDGSRVVYIGV